MILKYAAVALGTVLGQPQTQENISMLNKDGGNEIWNTTGDELKLDIFKQDNNPIAFHSNIDPILPPMNIYSDVSANGKHSLLIRPLDEDNSVVQGDQNSDTITLLVRGGPMFKEDRANSFDNFWQTFNQVQFKSPSNNPQGKKGYFSLFDLKMRAELEKTNIYMMNEEQFNISYSEISSEIANHADYNDVNKYTSKLNLYNAIHVRDSVKKLRAMYPNKKINVISWSYGSLITNEAIALWPEEMINNVDHIAIIGTILNPETHPGMDMLWNNQWYNFIDHVHENPLQGDPNQDIIRGNIFASMINTSTFDYKKLLDRQTRTGGTYTQYIKNSHKLAFFQNTNDNSIGPLSNNEIKEANELGELHLNHHNYSNTIGPNHYDFREYDNLVVGHTNTLLDFLNR